MPVPLPTLETSLLLVAHSIVCHVQQEEIELPRQKWMMLLSLSGYFYADNEFLLSAKLQTPFTFMRDAKLDSTGEKQVVQDDRRIKFSEEMQ